MNTSLEAELEMTAGSAARWIDVGFWISIFVERWVAIRGSMPRPVKVEESVKGALLGFPMMLGADFTADWSIFGLYENREDMTCVGARGLDGTCSDAEVEGACERCSDRGRFAGREMSGASTCGEDVDFSYGRVLRFATRLAFSLRWSESIVEWRER